MKNIVLSGFMGTGKTEAGRELARILGWNIIDVDDEIVKAEKMTINEIFAQFGEPAFRDMEAAVIRGISKKKNVIIATGGGAVLRQDNTDALRQNGIVVCLTASPETILKRIGGSSERPLLKVKNPLRKIRELMQARMPFYQKADIVIDTEKKAPREVAVEILERCSAIQKTR